MDNLIPTHRVVKTMLIQEIFKSKPIITLSLPKMGEGRLGGGFDGEIRPVKSGDRGGAQRGKI
ncbi:MAG: hypothetical protein ABSF10_18110 [Verrucomicrobiota bacterium]|jgi:hypothetical protein